MKLCFATLLFVSNVLLARGDYKVNETALTSKQEENVVNVLKITPDEDQKKEATYLVNLARVVTAGIEEVAMELRTKPGTLSTTPSSTHGSSTPSPMTQTSTEEPTPEKPPTAAEGASAKEVEEAHSENVRSRREAKEAASTTETLPALTTVLVIRSNKGLAGLDLSEPIEFFVETELEIIDGKKLKDKADDIKTAIVKKANEDPKNPVKLTVTVVGQGLAAWAIVLIVIAVLLVVGAAGYFLITYFRKQRGNSF